MFTIRDLWVELGTIPVNDDGITEEQFLHFSRGTQCEDIWHWFEDTFDVVVHDLMFPNDPPALVIKIARQVAGAHMEDWPEDEWHQLSLEWDLNLTNNGDEKGATLYRIKDGNTQTNQWWDVPFPRGNE